MSECKPAAASTTPTSSCERIIADFQAQGAPSNPTNVKEGSVLGGYEVMTPRVGTGFIEWAMKDYDLQGRTKDQVTEVNYDKYGDWMFDKKIIPPVGDHHADDDNYRNHTIVTPSKK